MDFVGEPVSPVVTIRAYTSGLFPPVPGEWPKAWAIVHVDSGHGHDHWSATVELDELVRELRHRTSAPMRDDLTFEWAPDGVALDLGPARVTGAVAGWRALIKRLLAEAGDTSELYETPSARVWHGVPTAVSVGEVNPGTGAAQLRPALTNTDVMVADALGLDPAELIDLIGAEWHGYRHDGRRIDGGASAVDAAVFVWGVPAQLAVMPDALLDTMSIQELDRWADRGLDPRGRALVGVPHPTWDGRIEADAVTHRVILDPWAPDEVVTIVKSLRARRRRAFGFCQLCGTYSAPEDKQGPLCWGCARTLYGLIH